MPRRLRHCLGGYVYHLLNRAVGRATCFPKATDYEGFVRVLAEASELAASRRSVIRGVPFGAAAWQQQTAKRLGLQSTMKPVGQSGKIEKTTKKE